MANLLPHYNSIHHNSSIYYILDTMDHTKTEGETKEFANKAEGFHEINPACSEVFEALKLRRKHRYIVYRIGEAEIEIEKIGGRAEV